MLVVFLPGEILMIIRVNPLTAEQGLRALIDFTLYNARRFYSSLGKPMAVKGLSNQFKVAIIVIINQFKLEFDFNNNNTLLRSKTRILHCIKSRNNNNNKNTTKGLLKSNLYKRSTLTAAKSQVKNAK